MAICTKIRRKSKRVCIGSLNRYVLVLLRKIQPPSQGSVDFSEGFTEERKVWAMIDTVTGVTVFDKTQTEHVITHDIYIRYVKNFTPEKWIKLLSVNGGDNVLLDIWQVENFGENNEFFRMRCNIRGTDQLPVNEA